MGQGKDRNRPNDCTASQKRYLETTQLVNRESMRRGKEWRTVFKYDKWGRGTLKETIHNCSKVEIKEEESREG